jgi:CheY-specific phosphatase CheX
MLGCASTAHDASPIFSAPGIAATVAFSGHIEGQCAVFLSETAAAQLAESLLGPVAGGWDTALVEDAVGELCNMVAGGWKKRLGTPECAADLTVPVIAPGAQPSNRTTARTMANTAAHTTGTVRRAYAFNDSLLIVDLSWIGRGPA